MKVFGLSKSPAPTAVLLIQEEEGSPPSWLAWESCWWVGSQHFVIEAKHSAGLRSEEALTVVRTAGSPIPDFINSSGDFNAPPLRMTRPVADNLMVLVTPPLTTTTPVATPPVRTTRWTQVPLCKWKLGRFKAVCI